MRQKVEKKLHILKWQTVFGRSEAPRLSGAAALSYICDFAKRKEQILSKLYLNLFCEAEKKGITD